MKLCIVTHNIMKGDGQGRANYEVVWEAIRRGHHVTLLSSKIDPVLEQHKQINWICIPVKEWPTELFRNLVFSWHSTNWLRQYRTELDLVIVNGSITKSSGDINAVHFVHGSWLRSPFHPWRLRQNIFGAYQWLYTALNTYWEKKSFREAKLVVAVSEKIKEELVKIGIPSDRIRVILNGVDLQEFSPGCVDRSPLGLTENVLLALFVGDIRTPRKNLGTVLRALVQVPELHLAVVGTTDRSPYPHIATKLGLGNRVHFLGYRLDVAEIMKAVDLFVFPSHYEPFGMVVSEAMAAALPIITAATTGVAEIVTPECGIVLTNSEDTQALTEALKKMTNNSSMRAKMGQVGRLIAEQHSWESKAQNYLDLFEELASQ
jgi:glycosyltransferase involved in cell wall biosynthesis